MLSLGGFLSDTVNLSSISSIVLAIESNLESVFDMEGSSLIVTLLSNLCRALFANRLASTLIALFCMSSRVVEFLSLSWYEMSASKPSGNVINAKPYGGLISAGIALYRLLKRVQ